ncbi:cupin domain-containing protein [Nannocystis sp.]|uniref:JmjC domain-containing protein n=1 Tax=Nannocystis sp. TaxID=1962667 RepID=UPI0025E8A797|nr:cupin domain-containing protein [Nannocystis sp.]MBK7825681.1 hypothetical protein [Nannocystis sp.]
MEATALLDSVLAGDFMTRCWRRRFVYIPGGAAGLLPTLPTIAEVEARLAGAVVELGAEPAFLSFPRAGEVIARRWQHATPGAWPVDEAINVPHAERLFPRLAGLAEALTRRFAAPANLQLFLGRAGAGLRPHSDIHDSFIVQIAGRKRWVVEDPDPTASLAGNAGGRFGAGARELLLAPGDLLYKPSHGLHATVSEDLATLSLTASIVTVTAADALQRWLAGLAAVDPAWRVRLPLAPDDTAALVAALADLPALLPGLAELLGVVDDD